MSDYTEDILRLVNPDFRLAVGDLLRRLPRHVIQLMVELKPDSNIDIYCPRMFFPDILRTVNWNVIMVECDNGCNQRSKGPLKKNAMQREPLLLYLRYGTLLALLYVLDNGICMEEDRPFNGCSPDIPRRVTTDRIYIRDFVTCDSMEEVFQQLAHQPIGATLAIFQPEYTNDQKKKIYRGPTSPGSHLCAFHEVSLVAARVDENGERYVLARSSQGVNFGHDGCIKVSFHTLILGLETGHYPDSSFYQRFSQPAPLLFDFFYPRLLSKEDENDVKRRKLSEIKSATPGQTSSKLKSD